ncbi:MAG: hypothetical protein D6776_10850 [Planctomycetota bacterium]|nr:MAG: hypothetical protein D6776_10850 [Planctomycetota bacterium]
MANGAVGREGYTRFTAMQAVRELLIGAGSADAVGRDELLAHREDLLEIRDRAARLGRPGTPLAHLFRLSDEVSRLIERLAAEGFGRGETAARFATHPPVSARFGDRLAS